MLIMTTLFTAPQIHVNNDTLFTAPQIHVNNDYFIYCASN